MFDTVVGRHPDRPFIITDDAALTYRGIRDWSMALAGGLVDLGAGPGTVIALLIDNRTEMVAAKLAVARIGAIAAPLNYSYRGDELIAALHHCGAEVLITISRSLATDFLQVLDERLPGWERRGSGDETLPRLRRVVLVDDDRPGAETLKGLAERGRGVPTEAIDRLTDAVDPDSVCDIVFTSGTTGHPVAAELTHDMVLRSAYGSAYHRAFDDGWRICFSLPVYHVFGYIEGLLAAMMVGGAVIPRRVFNPVTMLQAIAEHRADEVLLVPTMTVALVGEASQKTYHLGALRSVFSAAASAPVRLWEQVHDLLAPEIVFTGYGQTEVSASTALTLPGDPLDVVSETVGTCKLGGAAALPGMDGRLAQYRALDPFTGAARPTGTEGELAASGPIVARNYHNDPEQTAVTIVDGWLRTGDLGTVDADGYLRLTGRARELFKIGGELVAPKQVEDVLTGIPGVAQAFVVGVPDERYGEVGHAWIVPDGSKELDPKELTRYCRDHLAPFKVPRAIHFIDTDALPTTTTGKVKKYLLAQNGT